VYIPHKGLLIGVRKSLRYRVQKLVLSHADTEHSVRRKEGDDGAC
jgi:hypothetical protein